MKLTNIFLLATALTFQISRGADETNLLADTKTIISNAEQMKTLRKEVDDAEAAYMKSAVSDENSDQTEKLWNSYKQLNNTNFPKIFELARQQPKSERAFEMFEWIVTNRFIQTPTALQTGGLQSMEFLRDYYATNPNIARTCRIVGSRWEPTCQPVIDFLQIAADKNPDREVRGQATFALARVTKDKADLLVAWEDNSHRAWFEKHGINLLEEEKNGGSKKAFLTANELFQTVLNKYADCPTLQPTNTWQYKATLGEAAKGELFELDHLSLGKVAPEIEGEDIDGKKLKLSDYRGKIVVLSFWASWCGPCMAMVPSEVRLAERMKGKPFTLVGVNGDGIRDDAKHAVEKEKMTWPSFWSIKGPDGPIPTSWNVSGWPTVFVLDSNGVIRFKSEGYGGTNTENILNQKIDRILDRFADKTHP
ncbi:MAG TPA: TlpA disulfide reductase family protein [Verrucomicrobiae bacterium]|nr:TlpA disulfide reductase family protein [Verrucomicrobiae bacterium]